jgi:prepilin-type N-terminal cleavage/methylation domain-containing protein
MSGGFFKPSKRLAFSKKISCPVYFIKLIKCCSYSLSVLYCILMFNIKFTLCASTVLKPGYVKANCGKTTMRQSHKKAFTLAELLVALSILGVIATFTIPKLLSTNNNAEIKANFKEIYATLSDISSQSMNENTSTEVWYIANQNYNYLKAHLSVVKACDSNVSTEGCWDTATQGNFGGWGTDQPGFVLNNGVIIAGYMHDFKNQSNYLIDLNGTKGPNIEGEDQMTLNQCPQKFSNVTWDCPNREWGYRLAPGTIGPMSSSPLSLALWQKLMQ